MRWGAHACGKNNFFSLFTFRRTTKFAKIEIIFCRCNMNTPQKQKIYREQTYNLTNQSMSNKQTNDIQRSVEEMTGVVNSELGAVKNNVTKVLQVMRRWRKNFNFGNTKLNQQNMWNKYKNTNTVPVNELHKFFEQTKLPNLEHMFKNMFSGRGGYDIGSSLFQFRDLYYVLYEKHNHSNGVRIFVGEFDGDWVKDQYNELLINFIFDCVFSHRFNNGKSPFDHFDKSYNPLSLNKFKNKWLNDFDVTEFAYVAGLIIFILGEPQFRLYEAQQNRTLYTPANGPAFLRNDPYAVVHQETVVTTKPNSTIAETWDDEDETLQDVNRGAAEEPALIHYGWDDEDEDEEPEMVPQEPKPEPTPKPKANPEKRKRKSKRPGKKEREFGGLPQGDLPDLPPGTVLGPSRPGST